MDYIIGEAASQETAKKKCTKKVEIKPSPDYRKAQAYLRQAADNGRIAPGLWDNLSQSSAGLGSSPTSIFAGPAASKNFGVWPHPNCLPLSGSPEKPPKNEKNEGPLYLTSVSLAFCSPSAVASMTVNSFSSIVLSSLSICWRQSLSPFCLSG